MTKDKDIVEPATDWELERYADYSPIVQGLIARIRAEQATIAASRARYDKMREDAFTWKGMYLSADKRAEAAAARVKELEAEVSNLDAELDHWSRLAVDDLGKNPPTSWKEIADTAIRERDEWKAEAESLGDSREQMRCKKKAAEAERDEARKALKNARDWALEEAANTIDDMQCIGPCYAHYDNMSQTIRDLRRASLASSNREGGE